MWMSTHIPSTTFIVVCVSLAVYVSAERGVCYSTSQIQCSHEWGQLWSAVIKKENICRQFGEVHKCTLQSMTTCQFEPHEIELFEKDIVNVYTRDPYNCQLTAADYPKTAKHEGGSGSKRNTVTSILLLCTIIFHLL